MKKSTSLIIQCNHPGLSISAPLQIDAPTVTPPLNFPLLALNTLRDTTRRLFFRFEEEEDGPGGTATGEGDENVVRGRDHGVGGDGVPELGEQVAPEAVGAEPAVLAAAGDGGDGNRLVGLALDADRPGAVGGGGGC